MSLFGTVSAVDRPCKEVLSYPLQCFQEVFFATPAVVGTFFVGVGGFAVAVLIWGAIFALVLFALFFVLRQLLKGTRYFFTQTRLGQRVAALIPFRKNIERFFTKAQEVQPKKLINTQAINDLGSNIVAKVQVDSKWFKSVLKRTPFGKEDVATRSPNKTPQRSTSRISALTPKILSPKLTKQQ